MSERGALGDRSAMLLSRRRAGEGHGIVRLLLDDDRVIAAFVPAADRSQRRFGSRIRSYDTFVATIRQRASDRFALERIERTERSRSSLSEKPAGMAAAALIVEMFDRLVPDGSHEQPYFAVLNSVLDRMQLLEATGQIGGEQIAGWVLEVASLAGYSEGARCCACGYQTAVGRVDDGFRRAWCQTCSKSARVGFDAADLERLCRAIDAFFVDNMHVKSRSVPLIRLAQRASVIDERTAV